MSLWLSLFVYSGSAIILFIALKILQMRFGVLLFWPEARHHTEMFFKTIRARLSRLFGLFSSTHFYIFLHSLVIKMKAWVVTFHVWLDRRSHKLTNLIRGRQHIDINTKASHFLHDIKTFKERFRKQ